MEKKHTAWPKKSHTKMSHTLILCWTAFSFDYSMQKGLCTVTTFIPILSCIILLQRSCIDYGRVGPLRKSFFSTSKIFSVGLRSGLYGQQSVCESYVSCSLQACMVGTGREGCITSSASLLTLMWLSLWNRVTLDISDHVTLFHCSRVQSLCSLAN